MNEIIYQGNALPLNFGMKVISNYVKAQNSSFEEAVTTTNPISTIESIVTITTLGLNEGSRRSGSDKRYTDDDVWDMFDDDPELLGKVSGIFMEAITPLTDKLGALGSKINPKVAPIAKQKRKP